MKKVYKELIETIVKAQTEVWENEKKKRDLGTRENPYTLYLSRAMYNHIKENNLIDEDDMYMAWCGWTKVVAVEIK